jgi:hypothetical protein
MKDGFYPDADECREACQRYLGDELLAQLIRLLNRSTRLR